MIMMDVVSELKGDTIYYKLINGNDEIYVAAAQKENNFLVVTFDDETLDKVTSEIFTNIMKKVYREASTKGLEVKCDKELFFKKVIDETEDALILDVEPIGFDGQIKLDDMSLYMCIERPVRETCKALSDKGIMTLMSSANANDVKTRYTKIGMYRHLRGDEHFNIGNGYAWVMIDWASLSQENKQSFTKLNSGEIQIPLTETEKASFEHNCKLNQFPFKQSELVKFFEVIDYYKLVIGQVTPNQLPQSSSEDTYFDSVKSGYVVDNSLLNHSLDFRAVVIKCPIDETTKASDVNKYFNFIVQKLTMQASKKYPILN